MKTWFARLIGALFIAGTLSGPAWAQEAVKNAANPPAPPTSDLVTALTVLIPGLLFLLIFVPLVRGARKASGQTTESLELVKEVIRLGIEQVALQKETNRLLTHLIDAVSRR